MIELNFIIMIFLLFFVLNLKIKMENLEKLFEDLKKSVLPFVGQMDQQKNILEKEKEEKQKPPPISTPIISAPLDLPDKTNSSSSSTISMPLWEEKYAPQIQWVKDNWTGLLGISILVLGVSFIQVYLSLRSGPIMRFVSLLTTSLALFGTSVYIEKRLPFWQTLGGWLRSASGAILLMTCAGSSYFDALHFYESSTLGFSLFITGVLGNLMLAWFNPLSYALTLSMVLNFIALHLTPVTLEIQYLAFLTTFFGCLGMAKKSSFLQITLVVFIYEIFNYSWAYADAPKQDWIHFFLTGFTLTALPLGIYFRHISVIIERDKIALNVISLLTLWGLLLLQILQWLPNPFISMMLLYSIGLTMLFLSWKKRTELPEWIIQTHLMVSMLYVGYGLCYLINFDIGPAQILEFLLPQMMIFCIMCHQLKFRFISYITHAIICALIFCLGIIFFHDLSPFLYKYWEKAESYFYRILIQTFVLGVAVLVSRMLYPQTYVASSVWRRYYTIFFAAALYCAWILPLPFFAALILSHMVMQRYLLDPCKKTEEILLYSIGLTMVVAVSLGKMFGKSSIETNIICSLLGLSSFMLFLSPHAIQLPNERRGKYDLWLYSLSIYSLFCFLFVFKNIKPFFVSGIFLSMIILLIIFREKILTLFKTISDKESLMRAAFQNVIIGLLSAFLLRHIFVHIEPRNHLMSYIFTFLGMMTCGLKVFYDQQDSFLKNSHILPVKSLTSYLFRMLKTAEYEIFFLLLWIFIAWEIPKYAQIIPFSMVSLFLAYLPKMLQTPIRIRTYAWIAFFAACVHLSFVTTQWETTFQMGYSHTHITGPIGILILFLAGNMLILRSSEDQKKSSASIMLGIVPVFLTSCLFLYERFDQAYLTILFVMLCLLVIGLAFFWRSLKLLQFAYAVLAFCIIRLLFLDLGESDLLVRAVVFITVGGLMIVAQMIYKKFRHRLS